ncbi:beta-ketoacyl synthase N-terminal-like domain-containing protein [Nocardia farcinica]|uniref:beta-ketoacyl synthase N-terminal-like domain-containing protein n=1 Tax=Nocardia farcinica TaxID=37329 RepID=UPI003CC80E86
MTGEPIAIVGMAGRFPGADSVARLWELLAAGIDAVAACHRTGGTRPRRGRAGWRWTCADPAARWPSGWD